MVATLISIILTDTFLTLELIDKNLYIINENFFIRQKYGTVIIVNGEKSKLNNDVF